MSIENGAPPDSRGEPLLQSFPPHEPDTAEVSQALEPDQTVADQAGPQAQVVTQRRAGMVHCQEWACVSDSDSDAEPPHPETRRRDSQRQRNSQHEPGDGDVHRVELVSTSREWARAGLSISSSEFEAAPARVQWKPHTAPHGAVGMEQPHEASSTSLERQNHSRPWKRCLLIGIFSAMNTCDLVMRIWSLVTLWGRAEVGYCCIIVPLQLLSTLLSAYITFHDPDVLFWLHRLAAHRPACRPLAVSMVCCLFSCLQMIQVKQAVARQLHAAEVMTEMTETAREDRGDARATTASSLQGLDKKFGGSEKYLPVALFTGVPYLITMVYATQRREWVMEAGNDYLRVMFSISISVCLLTVTMAIIEIDLAMSAYVFKRYHFNPALKGTCAANYHCIYRLFHWSVRTFEVSMRILVIAWFVLMSSNNFQKKSKSAIWRVFVLIFDYVIGVVILRLHAPREERFTVHVLVGVALMVADLAHFVDQPNFAEPARYISKLLSLWHFLQIIVLLVPEKMWTVGPLLRLGMDLAEVGFTQPVKVLGRQACFSVDQAAQALKRGTIQCDEDLCVVFSASRQGCTYSTVSADRIARCRQSSSTIRTRLYHSVAPLYHSGATKASGSATVAPPKPATTELNATSAAPKSRRQPFVSRVNRIRNEAS